MTAFIYILCGRFRPRSARSDRLMIVTWGASHAAGMKKLEPVRDTIRVGFGHPSEAEALRRGDVNGIPSSDG